MDISHSAYMVLVRNENFITLPLLNIYFDIVCRLKILQKLQDLIASKFKCPFSK